MKALSLWVTCGFALCFTPAVAMEAAAPQDRRAVLDRVLQLAQGHPGDIRQFQQVEVLFRAVGRPLANPLHDHPFSGATLQRTRVETHASVVEDEQAVVEQLLSEGHRVADRGHARQRAT